MRQLAWLQTVPTSRAPQRGQEAPTSRAPQRGQEAPRRTRAEVMRDDGVRTLPLPPVQASAHLVRHLFDVGPSVPAGMGEGPVGYGDIAAWQSVTGIVLQPWGAQMLRQASQAYVAERVRAQDPDCAPPWAEIATDERAALSARVQAALRARLVTTRSTR